jgi:hypothetical protein
MLRSKIVAAALATMLLFTSANISEGQPVPTPPAPSSSNAVPVGIWLIFGCASGIILAAAVANARDNRELTQSEAITCGLLFWLAPPRPR